MSRHEAQDSIKTNIPEFTVGDLALSLKKTIESQYGRVRVRGELSRVSIAASGHMYSSLKDENAVIDAVCWKGTMAKMDIKPEEGLEVICTGRLSTYPARSNYQLIIESMTLAGEGALLKMLEERRKKLQAEGLFDADKKKELPFLPNVIGVVTSPTGAVIQDIMHRIQDRFPRRVILWPALVQGQGAAVQIAEAIDGFQSLEAHGLPRPDVLIVGRGGGSLEDLMPFNEEIIVRAVARSAIPVISAVGHETDVSLCDFAADKRAPTPSAAAEMAVPVRAELMARVLDHQKRLYNAGSRILTERKSRLDILTQKISDPARIIELYTQRLDHTGMQLQKTFQNVLSTKTQALMKSSLRLQKPQARLDMAIKALERWSEQLTAHGTGLLTHPEKRLAHAGQMLEAYSFENTLRRGFVVIQDRDQNLVTDPSQTKPGHTLALRFSQKRFVDVVVSPPAGGKPSKRRNKNENKTQGDLF